MMQFKRNYYLTDSDKQGLCFVSSMNIKSKSSIDNAIRIYKVADQLLDKIKTEQTDLESLSGGYSRRLYENVIAACSAGKCY
jgi:hypothetical protein